MAYFMVEEERLHNFQQKLVKAKNYNEAYLTYTKQIVKPMLKTAVAISQISKEMAFHPDAPSPVEFNGKKEFKEKERDFYVEYKGKAVIVTATSFDAAIEKLKATKKNFDKFEVEIRIAADFLIKKTKRLKENVPE